MEQLDFSSWQNIKGKVQIVAETPDLEALPDNLPLSYIQILGITDVYDIPKNLWDDINDPDIEDSYTKLNFISKYFSVCVFTAEKNLKISLGANTEYSETVDIKHVSSTRMTQSKEFRIANVIEGSYSNAPAQGQGGSAYSLKDTLTTEYSIKNLKEYYNEDSSSTSRTIKYLQKDYDREIVLWDFKKYVAIYRVYDGNTSLVAVDDYLYGSELLTYKRDRKQYVID
ncbi:MAG: hypothetical protein APF77_01620 [Clostridia bacterium BRH_c25]|nr:MAG: hypothetical protein APF77_01620 [Clostridia bacterium BRH_c25]